MKVINQVVRNDILIIGGGLAGCLAALEAKEKLGKRGIVAIVDKGFLSRSGQSPFAAGVWTFFDPKKDDMNQWMEEIVTWGEYINDQVWCRQLYEYGHVVALKLDRWASEMGKSVFLKDENGEILRRQSRGHYYTYHAVIDPLQMMDVLRKKLVASGIKIYDRIMITDLFSARDAMIGAAGFNYVQDKTFLFLAPVIVLAASGSGFKATYMGHRNLTGDLQAAAFEQGAILTNMEQFYSNTVARDFDIHGLNLYVGVGGRFLNGLEQEFMWDYHPTLGNRAPLQFLSLAFSREVAEGRGPMYLDITKASKKDQELCRRVLPESFRIWDRSGVSPFAAKVPWMPALRGTCAGGGGIKIDLDCRTNIPGLYAAGDICWIGPHGTYSFGGINIGFTSVSGYLAGQKAAHYKKTIGAAEAKTPRKELQERLCERFMPLTRQRGKAPGDALRLLQEIVVPYPVAYLKSAQTLQAALEKLEMLERKVLPTLVAHNSHELVKAIEIKNMVTLATLMIRASLVREESRGFHFRTEFPYTDNQHWLKRILVRKEEKDELAITLEDVETPFIKPKDTRSLPPGVKSK